VRARRPVAIPDLAALTLADGWHQSVNQQFLAAGLRSVLVVPLLRAEQILGALVMRRRAAGEFPAPTVRLLETFAAQSALAIQNARLFDQLQARNRELRETLEQQTATAEILRVMSQSPADYQPVLAAVARSAVEVCQAEAAGLILIEGDEWVVVCQEASAAPAANRSSLPPVGFRAPLASNRAASAAMRERRTIALAGPTDALLAQFPESWPLPDRQGWPSALFVPLLLRAEAIGCVVLVRWHPMPTPFTAQQIALVEAFASQAAIAIDNARLFGALEARTRELARSVEELRALSEVGRTVNSSLDLPVVLETVLARAVELSGGDSGIIYTYEAPEDAFQLQTVRGLDPRVPAEAHARFGVPVRPVTEAQPDGEAAASP